MAWTPTYSILAPRAIASNLLAWFSTNQTEAILWANAGTALRPLKSIADALADPSNPVFPALQFLDDNDAADYSGDQGIGSYSVTFECMVQSAVPATAIQEARVYDKAIKSMIRECPDATLLSNSGAVAINLQTIEGGFDPIKTNDLQNDFLQVFQVRAVFLLAGSH
jgi:hypothetical protein